MLLIMMTKIPLPKIGAKDKSDGKDVKTATVR